MTCINTLNLHFSPFFAAKFFENRYVNFGINPRGINWWLARVNVTDVENDASESSIRFMKSMISISIGICSLARSRYGLPRAGREGVYLYPFLSARRFRRFSSSCNNISNSI